AELRGATGAAAAGSVLQAYRMAQNSQARDRAAVAPAPPSPRPARRDSPIDTIARVPVRAGPHGRPENLHARRRAGKMSARRTRAGGRHGTPRVPIHPSGTTPPTRALSPPPRPGPGSELQVPVHPA